MRTNAMPTKVASIQLDRCRSPEEIREAIKSGTHEGRISMLMWDGEVICAAVSLDRAKDAICRSVVQHWAENPQLLGDLLDRIETEQPEEWR